MKKSNGGKYILIRRTGAAPPKADNTIGMYKRDGKGAYTTSEEDDSVPMTPIQKASDDAEKRRAADAKKREAIQDARERLQQSNKANREKLQQTKTAKVDETRVGDIVKGAMAKRAHRKSNERRTRTYLDSVKNRVDPADSIRGALKGSPYLRKRVMKNSFEPDLEERNNPVVAATIKQGEQNVAKAKEAKRAADHSAMVKKLIAARGTKPKKPLGIWKGKTNEGTNARERGEVQSPRSQDEYDALSPENKKLVDKRTQNARKQSMSANPGESPRNKRTKRKPRNRNRNPHLHDPEGEWGEETDNHGEELGENLAYSKPDKKGRTFVVSKRKTKGMRGKQDQVSMSVRDSKGNIEDHGSHVNVKGAKKYATSRGYNMGEGAARDREERVYGSGASRDMNHGVEREDANTRRARARYRAQERERNRRAEQGGPKPTKKKLGETNLAKPKAPGIKIKPGKSSRRLKPPPAPPKGYEEKHPLSQKDRAAIRNKLGQEKYPQTEEVSWEEAQYWSEGRKRKDDYGPGGKHYDEIGDRNARDRYGPPEKPKKIRRKRKDDYGPGGKHYDEIGDRNARDRYGNEEEVEWDEAQYWSEDTVAAFLKRGGKITKVKPRVARGATKKKTIRLKGTKSTDRGRKAEKKMHGEEVEEIDEISRETKDRYLKAASKDLIKQKERSKTIWWKKDNYRGGKTPIARSQDSVAAAKRKVKNRVRGIRRAADTVTIRKEDVIDEGGMGNNTKRPMSAARKARHDKHQQFLKITGMKKSKVPRKKARGKTEISKTASRYEDIEIGEARRLTAAQRFLKKKAEKAAEDSPEEDRYREPTKKHVGKEYAISRTTGKPGAKPRLVRGGGKSDTQKTLDKIERNTEEYSLDEAKMKVILKRVIRGASPFTIVALKNGRAIDQEHAKISQAVPAFVREMKKKHPNARISVEDRTGRVLHTEEYIDEAQRLTGWERSASKKAAKDYKRLMARHTRTRVFDIPFAEFREIETSANKVMGVRPGGLLTPGSLVRDLDKFATNESVNVDEGGMGGRHFNVKGGSIPSNAEIKAFYEKQKGSPSQRIAATKKHFGLQKMTVSARGIVSAKGIREAVSVDGRTRDYRGTRTRLEAKGRRRGEGLDGRTKGYRDARTRITARQQRAAADAAMMEPEEAASTEIEEMQSGSKQSPVDASTASSNLKYKSGSRHATGTSKRPEKKRASKAARQVGKKSTIAPDAEEPVEKRGTYHAESSVSITPEREAEIRKKVRADIEKDRQAKKARDKKDGRYMDHWGNWRTKGKPNPADELTRDFNKESIDKEELKRLMHKKDLDNRHRRREDKAAQRTAKSKRSFGPKGKKPEGTMKIAFRKALEKKNDRR